MLVGLLGCLSPLSPHESACGLGSRWREALNKKNMGAFLRLPIEGQFQKPAHLGVFLLEMALRWAFCCATLFLYCAGLLLNCAGLACFCASSFFAYLSLSLFKLLKRKKNRGVIGVKAGARVSAWRVWRVRELGGGAQVESRNFAQSVGLCLCGFWRFFSELRGCAGNSACASFAEAV